jgi:Sulfotransferase family
MTAVIIGGHQRSGTTILAKVLARHPQVGLTVEFDNFQGLNKPLRENLRLIFKRWRTVRLRNDFLPPSILKRANFLRNSVFIPVYLAGLLGSHGRLVRLPAIERSLRRLFPGARVVGDKYPDYIFQMGRLIHSPDLRCIIIYRDCRDVTSSALVQARTKWRDLHFVSHFDTAEKVAARWVRAIEMMERYRTHIHAVRYEDLVREPQRELAAIAALLDIDPAGFPRNWLRDDRVGKHQRGLTSEELGAVMGIAGATMERLGYA